MNKFLLINFLVLVFTVSVQAQHIPDTVIVDNNRNSLSLPPLKLLMKNARNSPAVTYYDAKRNEEKTTLDIEKRNWLKYFNVNGSYRYGTSGGVAGEAGDPMFKFSNTAQNTYSLGFSVSVPFDDIFSRGLRNKKQSIKIVETELEQDKAYQDLKLLIIDLYTEAEKILGALKYKKEILVLTDIQYKEAVTDYASGRSGIDDLNTKKKLQTSATQDYEETKLSLNNVLLKLEIITQTPILINQ